ncbi:hypothetical protein STPYR_10186 [uncultured Stenotrophomonas sp.]|uniref:Uncharacterized protein n=1 Tax=uncultured Stenotrophomonas sp. TaxID=165438 RepID=A0A1Y5Q2Y2_9GAMM|nr:hypothetical protein STPYR_10186 [uncultured Stenotrophomonas sp.]
MSTLVRPETSMIRMTVPLRLLLATFLMMD